jgi:hypothetical protein
MSVLEFRRENAREGAHRNARLPDLGATSREHERLLCSACLSPVTSESELVAIAGSRLHHRTNPNGIEFEFACFRAAPGAEVRGQPTTEFSWFPGYAWSYSMCRSCDSHLGWHFEGRNPSFHGLILDRLTREDPGERRRSPR